MPVYLFHGDNHLEIDDAVRSLRERFDQSDILTLDGPTVSLQDLAEACVTAGLFAPNRLVIVRKLHDRFKGTKRDNGLEEIGDLLHTVPETTTVALVDKDMAANHELATKVRSAGGELRHLSMPRKGDLPRWIMERGKQHEVTIEREAANLLADLVGANPLMLESELNKLATYAGADTIVTLTMVENLVGAVPQDSVFALVDAIAGGDRRKALQLLHGQLERASSNPVDVALQLIRLLARQMRILLRLQLSKASGQSQKAILTELKIPPYYASRYLGQANRLSQDRVTASFEQLAALEYGLKSGKAEPESGLEVLVAELCA